MAYAGWKPNQASVRFAPGLLTALQLHPHLKDGTVYRQVRTTPKRLGLAMRGTVQWLQGPQPHLEHGSAYRQNRPTVVDSNYKLLSVSLLTPAFPKR